MGKKKNFIGERFGRQVVISEVPKEQRKNRKVRELICQCDCGNLTRVIGYNLVRGDTTSCGCYARELAHQRSIDKVIGKRFGRLIALKEADDSSIGYTKILCQCDCGTEKSIFIDSLTQGTTQSCGCLLKERQRKAVTKDITGMVFGELTAIKPAGYSVRENGDKLTQWLFRCSCGKEVVARTTNVVRGYKKSCGHIGSSYAEHRMFLFLSEHNIPFEYNVNNFDGLINPKTGCRLIVDFVITCPNGSIIVVEHQGKQHYEIYSNGFGKLQREVTDDIKRQYFEKHNIPFYETRYDEDYMLHLENILTENGFNLEEER